MGSQHGMFQWGGNCVRVIKEQHTPSHTHLPVALMGNFEACIMLASPPPVESHPIGRDL